MEENWFWLNTVYVMRDIMFDSECLLKRPIMVNIKINWLIIRLVKWYQRHKYFTYVSDDMIDMMIWTNSSKRFRVWGIILFAKGEGV